ncbi:MAG: ribosome silencing factor [Bdellovibrionota bacterium]
MKASQSISSRELALLCARAAIDKKAGNSLIFEVGKLGAFTDYFLITSGSNERQVQAIADEIAKSAKSRGLSVHAIEGYDEGRWVLVDFGDVVVHIFHEYIREFYDLESLWSTAPRLRIPEEYYTLPKSAEISTSIS